MLEWLCWRKVVKKTGRTGSTRNRKLSRWHRLSRRISRWRRSRPTSRRSAQQIWHKLHSHLSEALPSFSQNILFYYFTTWFLIFVSYQLTLEGFVSNSKILNYKDLCIFLAKTKLKVILSSKSTVFFKLHFHLHGNLFVCFGTWICKKEV